MYYFNFKIKWLRGVCVCARVHVYAHVLPAAGTNAAEPSLSGRLYFCPQPKGELKAL